MVVVLLGIIMLAALGFNKSFDFTGGTIASVTVEQSVSDEEAVKNVKDVLKDYTNIEVCSLSVGSSQGQTVITVKYAISTNIKGTNHMVLHQLYEAFGYDENHYAQKNYINMTTEVQPAYTHTVFTYALLGTLIATIAAAVYVFFRLGLSSAITLISTTIIDVLCGLAMILIFRLEISAHIGYAILAIATLSLVANSIMLSKLKEIASKPENKKIANAEVAEMARDGLMKPMFVFSGIAAVVLLTLAIIAFGPVGNAVLAVALGFISIFVTTLFINPSLWALAFVHKTKPAKQPIHEQVESEVEW